MDESVGTERPDLANESSAVVEETSIQYLARWSRLVSTTNWEKGRIIFEWRTSLIESGSPVEAYSDEAWSRRVGNVSSQHVGRLRRTCERFGDQYEQYPGLFWSHFQIALDWPDAEMWLEGAAQSGWSVSEMRAQRWEAIGAPPDLKPRDEDVITAELDEDSQAGGPQASIGEKVAEVRDVGDDDDSPPFDEFDSEPSAEGQADHDAGLASPANETVAAPPIRPFENLPKLPDDLADAVESMKLAIVSHKLTGWSDVSCDDVLRALDALKQLAVSPTDG
jgi:hypothetical protein